MGKRILSIEQLKDYCTRHNIIVSSNSTKSELESAIARCALNGMRIKDGSCFGYWNEDIDCEMCSKEDLCFKSSLGTKLGKAEYMEKMDRVDKVRFSAPMLKKKPKKASLKKTTE